MYKLIKLTFKEIIMNKKEKKIRQAMFTIFRIHSKEHKKASFFINLLFLLPIWIVWFKLILRLVPNKVFEDQPFTRSELSRIIGAKGILIDIKTHEGDRVFIKNI